MRTWGSSEVRAWWCAVVRFTGGLACVGAMAGCGGAVHNVEASSAGYAPSPPVTPAESAADMDAPGGAIDEPSPTAAAPPPPPGLLAQTTPTSVGAEPTKKRSPAGTDEAPRRELIIYTAHVTMAVYQVEPGLSAIERIAHDLHGFLASRNDNVITIRVPRASFEDALRRVVQTGDVLHRQIDAQDVTDEFVDLEARLKNLRVMRDRLAELLRVAPVKEALEIEKELGRVTQEIERIEGRLKVLGDKIAYSTITVTFQARGAAALRDEPLRLPYPWLSELGLPRLLNLEH